MWRTRPQVFAVLLVVAVAASSAGGCTSSRNRPHTASAVIRAAVGGRVSLDGAEIDVPKNALAKDARVTVTHLGGGPAVGGGRADTFEYDTGNVALRADVRLYQPTSGDTVALPVLASLGQDGLWDVIPATVDGQRITAEVPHLSQWMGFDLFGWLKGDVDAFTRTAQFLGLRADAPTCGHRVDPTVATLEYPAAIRQQQPPLLVCANIEANGVVTLRVVNNRTYAITLFPDGFGIAPPSPLQLAKDDYQVAQAVRRPGQVVLAPGDGVALTLDPHQPSGSLTYQPNVAATVVLDAYHIAKILAGEEIRNQALTLYDCAMGVTNSDSISTISDEIVKCVLKLLDPVLHKTAAFTLGGLLRAPKALVERALAEFQLAKEAVVPVLDALADHLLGSAIDVVTLTRVSHPAPRPTRGGTNTTTSPPAPAPSAPPPSGATPVTHYDCANDNSNIGKYIKPGTYWQNGFMAQGSRITGGWVAIGANTDGGDHRAQVGIYSAGGVALSTVVLPVTGYDGESFTLPSPLAVSVGQSLYLRVTGIGDFTAYDNRSGCFIGHVEGTL
jgi:hypothetical protein